VKYDTQRPYAASYVIVKNSEGKIAFVLRSNTDWMNGYYGLPAGKTEIKEPFNAGAIREAEEEIGIKVAAKDMEHVLTVHRYSPAKDEIDELYMEWVDVYFEAKKWQGEIHNAEPHKHSKVEWLDPNNLPENIIPPIVASIRAYNNGIRYLEYGYDK
jgi:8-oxo-dGTP pyrophosphatase MutT (NUDIX family)